MEPLSTIFLFIAILALFAAWALSRAPADPLDAGDMGPESVLQHGAWEATSGPGNTVHYTRVPPIPPIPLPAPAPDMQALPVTGQTSEPKRRRKPAPKRETKPDTRKVERKG